MRGEAPPRYIQRPLKLVADAEFRLKMIAYERRTAVFTNQPVTKISNPMETDYGKAYRQLIEIAKTNDIRLVLANFSMAVNSRSDRSDVEFYRTGFPPIYGWIAANATHTRLIDQLVQENPGVLFVDTQRQLDGNHGFFIDLVHFSPKGEQAMAEIFFAAIKNDLERDFVRADLTRESEQHSDHRYSVKPK